MRYERDNSLSRAAVIVSARVRSAPEYSAARAAVIAGALAEIGPRPTVDRLRSIGGISSVVERQIAALPDEARADRGSRLLPASIAGELTSELGELRFAVQAALARGAAG